jgi:hypothetical protein
MIQGVICKFGKTQEKDLGLLKRTGVEVHSHTPSSLDRNRGQEQTGRGVAAGPAKSPVLRQPRSSGAMWNMRGAREGGGEVLTAVGGEGMQPDFV